jgi:hypothetical protein
VCGDAFRLGAGVGEQSRSARVAGVTVDRGERLVNRRPDQRVNEAEGRLRAQDVDSHERICRLGGGRLVQIGQRGRLVRVGVVAQDRDRARERRRRGRQPR